MKQDSNDILKQFLYFLTINFQKKVDVNYKSLNKINLVFELKFGYFALYLEIYITDPILFISYFKIVGNIELISAKSIQSLIPDSFYCLLNFQCAKYSISLVQKGQLKAFWGECFGHNFNFHYIA